MDKKTITLELTDYVIKGTATILLWGDDIGEVTMHPMHLKELPEDLSTIEYNDGGFGCQRIISVDIRTYENYEGHLVLIDYDSIELGG